MKATLYTNDVREYIAARPWPKGLKWNVFEKTDENFLWLTFIREDMNKLNVQEILKFAETMNETMLTLQARGVRIGFKLIHASELDGNHE